MRASGPRLGFRLSLMSRIIFGSGYATLNEWWIAGAIMSVINLLLLLLVGSIWWSTLGLVSPSGG